MAINRPPILLDSIQGLSLFAKFHSQKEVDDYIDTVIGSFK